MNNDLLFLLNLSSQYHRTPYHDSVVLFIRRFGGNMSNEEFFLNFFNSIQSTSTFKRDLFLKIKDKIYQQNPRQFSPITLDTYKKYKIRHMIYTAICFFTDWVDDEAKRRAEESINSPGTTDEKVYLIYTIISDLFEIMGLNYVISGEDWKGDPSIDSILIFVGTPLIDQSQMKHVSNNIIIVDDKIPKIEYIDFLPEIFFIRVDINNPAYKLGDEPDFGEYLGKYKVVAALYSDFENASFYRDGKTYEYIENSRKKSGTFVTYVLLNKIKI